MSDLAVVLMAYGSPDRLADVPAYYADIRGGRPIRPELLADLVERYRRLGIEDSNPLNAITEETRAALEQELGVPVFTGMKHWQPRIGAAAELALDTGARTIVGLVLAPHYSRGSIAGYRQQLEDGLAGRAELAFVESWHDDPAFIALLADRVRGTDAHVVFTAHSLPARVLEGGDPVRGAAARDVAARRRGGGRPGLVVLVPVGVGHGRAVAAAGHPRPPRDAARARGVDAVFVCPVGFVSDHLEIRWDLDVEAAERAAELGMRYDRMEMPNADPGIIRVLAGIVRRTAALPSSA